MENSDFAMMPEELKDVIRSKLPPKSLARCIVVSKEWERSIGDRRLQHTHYQESKKQPMLVLLRLCQRGVWNDGEPQYESFNTVNQERPQPIADPHHVTTLPNSDFAVTSGPIRGLLCLVLCNPAIRKCLTVLEFEPEPPQTRKRFNHRGFLFGFDEQSKAFKVIKTEAGDHNLPWRHEIFTVQPGEVIWRQIDCPRPYTPITNSLSIEGNVYLGAVHNKTCLAVTVNLTTESILITELPTAFLLKLGITKLRSYNGQPCLVSDSAHELATTGKFKICVKDKDSGLWGEREVEVKGWREKVTGSYSFEGTIPSGELVFAKKKLETGFQMLLYYDPRMETFNEYQIQTEEDYDSAEIFLNHKPSIYI